MPLPALAKSEDVADIVKYLRGKPVGATLKEAKATNDKKLLHLKRVAAYENWGFVRQDGDKLLLTSLGIELAKASDEQKSKVFSSVLSREKIYRMTLEYIFRQNFEEMPANDIASHWANHFGNEVDASSERILREQVFSFMSIVSAAGIAEFVKGRRGKPTRLKVNRGMLEVFIEKPDEPDSTTKNENKVEVNVGSAKESDQNQTKSSQQNDAYPPAPTLHINIQVHISSDATAEQIDKIFESMAKHLFNRGID